MTKKAIIIIGKSGSGKGTQAKILKEFLESRGYDDVHHLTTGGGFRAFVQGDTYTAALVRDRIGTGGLAPEFAAIWNWSNLFMQIIRKETTVILDGAPRKIVEVEPLHSAIQFYGYENPIVVYLDVSDTWSESKLKDRERADDATDEERKKKMDWFVTDVLPCIEYYMKNPFYSFVHVNGEQTIEEVAKELQEKITSHI